jgi:multimeric flavodoxin WrbA
MPEPVLGIVGSPRRGGNTESLVDEVLRGAQEAGAAIEKVILSELTIAACDACDGCQGLGRCVHEDDMVQLAEKMERCQAWVLGTPVYWWGPSAQLKTFVDRWYGLDRALFRDRAVVLAIALGDSYSGTARHTVGMLTDSLNYLQARIVATVLAPGVLDVGDIRRRPDLLATARRAGRELLPG